MNIGVTFRQWWLAHFGECPPLGHALRATVPGRWVRFHSLPEAKRYATCTDEEEEVFRRASTLAGEVLGETCFMVVPEYVEREDDAGTRATISEMPSVTLTESFRSPPGQHFDAWAVFWVAEFSWNADSAAQALKAIADDTLRVTWVDPSFGEVFAPYDGGTDMILASEARVQELRQRYPSWMSPLPSGL